MMILELLKKPMKLKRYNRLVLLLLWAGFSSACFSQKMTYSYPFNPMQGLVGEEEKPFRQELCLNGSWDFMPVYVEKASDFILPDVFKKASVPIKIPSPWNVNDFTDGKGGDFLAYPSYPEEWKKAKTGWMKKNIRIPADWKEKKIILHFEGVLGKCQVYANGRKVAENFELFLPFEADLTPYVKPGENNEILVGVAKASLFDEPGRYGRRTYVGGSMWGTEMAGIWQDVYLFAYNSVYIQDVFIQPDVRNNRLKIKLEIQNGSSQSKTVDVAAEVKKWYNSAGRTIHENPEQKGELARQTSLVFPENKKVSLPANTVTTIEIASTVSEALEYWTPETPHLYGAVICLKENKNVVDKKQERFGWRQFEISGNQLLLNGERILLKGDSWHFTGVPQMTRRYPWAWFSLLKDANANAVRLHAQPFPRFYLDVADEMGICVLDETGIWSSDGGPKIDSEVYWESCVEHLKRLIKRDKNHASVFGWSVCNETVPVAVNVFKAPEELVQRQLTEINRWVEVVAETDPTRPWISGDGEEMRPTNLPVLIGHYGGQEGIRKWSKEGKPWGIGEQSMAYYGTPKQASQYNGDRAYESMLGRMEAIAIESYGLLKMQRELDATYSSIFNIVWYGLQPLDLGMKDASRAPQPDDGIFFGFNEGAYGMQPERLGPYTTTLNPGYDPSIPLYRAWPLFYAVRNANATPALPYSVAVEKPVLKEESVRPADAVVLLSSSPDSKLKENLENYGMKILSGVGKFTANTLLIIDGNHPPVNVKAEIDPVKKAIAAGATLWIMGLNPQSVDFVNTLLPEPISLEERKATSFLKQGNPIFLQGLGHADFYFSELIPQGGTALHYGMKGDFLAKADVLLRACNTDWQRWNNRPETSKTGNVFRSEQEAKGSDAVIVSGRTGAARIILSTLDFEPVALQTQPLLTKMLSNLGATVSNENVKDMHALNDRAQLYRALTLEVSGRSNRTVEQLLTDEIIPEEAKINPQLNALTNNRQWRIIAGDEKGQITFSRPQQGSGGNPVVYLSFWIYSPRSLSNLLAEPDMPALDMFVNTPDGFAVYMNNKRIAEQTKAGNSDFKLPAVPLDKGWNQVLIKLAAEGNNAQPKVSVRFESTDKNYMKQILSSVVR